eukprot:1285513-Rhodomonas_salina.1
MQTANLHRGTTLERKDEYRIENLSELADLPLVRKREELLSSLAESIVTPEVYAQLQQGWCVIDDAVSPELCVRALQGAKTLRQDGFMYRLKDEYAPGILPRRKHAFSVQRDPDVRF